ncbi:dynamin family protein [Paenibacillus protaetiae]|uniref:Dynamin N-terminal domain-containing protein n=1 Tax=Paenibacillus protaetiae TaxID=2509456 RepID=A0A4P6EVA5_9BACL|nr:dynamin family protein [Paenibacillus protaetiae]QAY66103.1 hypothetical protein ET464_06560 [Paenibacillus protaetiae]
MSEKPETTIFEQAIQAAAAEMAALGDVKHAGQLKELNSKLADGRLTVAFCGHFSAGKSTLINRLCGAKLLPSSPIPTSANVVSIRGGEQAVAAIHYEADGKSNTREVPVDQLEQYCVDGENFTSVSITYPSELLGNHTVLLDTPGIDSTDDAHRMATESALHLADVVFYVMDYNHVQSEINFAFAKQLKDWGKPLYFIVNQIDKHRENELSFEQYRKSVSEAFHAWHLEPAGIVYLSMREPEHPHQELHKLEELLAKLAEIREPLAVYSVDASLRHLVKAHLKWRGEQEEPEREQLIAEAGGEDEAARVKGEIERLTAERERLLEQPARLRDSLRKELQSLLDNANVTPAVTRDFAHSFLESRKPGFKTGLLFAGAKTAAEQERRGQVFAEDFASKVNANIDWHVKDLLRHAAEQCGYAHDALEAQLDAAFTWKPELQWLIGKVNTGAVFGNEYTMTYSRDIAAEVKSIYRKEALVVIDTLADHIRQAGELAAAAKEQELAALGTQAGALARLAALAERADAYAARLAAVLPPQAQRPALPAPSAGTAQPPRSGAAAGAARAEAAAAAAPARKAGRAAPAERVPRSPAEPRLRSSAARPSGSPALLRCWRLIRRLRRPRKQCRKKRRGSRTAALRSRCLARSARANHRSPMR